MKKRILSILFVSSMTWMILLTFFTYGSYKFGSLRATIDFLRGERLLVDHKYVNLGTMPMNESIRFSYKLTNMSSSTVKILGVNMTCSCLRPTEVPDLIKPGESENLIVNILTKETMPDINLTIDLLTSDPLNQSISLNVIGVVKKGSG